jgi:purine-binding chemotaxis protein CheW
MASSSEPSSLLFRVGGLTFAIPAALVDRIVDFQTPRPLPLTPAHIPGVIAQGEQVLAVLDLGRFLGLKAAVAEAGVESARRILAIAAGGMRVGILCDKVLSLRELSGAGAARVLQGEQLQKFVKGEHELEQGRVAVLDLPALLEAARVPGARR